MALETGRDLEAMRTQKSELGKAGKGSDATNVVLWKLDPFLGAYIHRPMTPEREALAAADIDLLPSAVTRNASSVKSMEASWTLPS